MSLANDIVLRPRFKIDLDRNNQEVLAAFVRAKNAQSDFIITRIDDHVFIKIPADKRHFWSPQLHLEIIEASPSKCALHGLFGPSPTVWTLFMFLHFIVAGFFIGFGIWAYSNWTLDQEFAIPLFLTIFMVILWIVLYFSGRIGKASGKNEMQLLYDFMSKHLNSEISR